MIRETIGDDIVIYNADCREVLASLPDGSVDAVITDPPYPEIDRDYGRMSEREWHEMMDVVVPECRRVLKPTGSAVFILQPNYETPGRLRSWLWEFMAKWSKEWNMPQDVYWWNLTAMPSQGCQRQVGLMRPSIKPCIWLGQLNCYRNQDAVLWSESESNLAGRMAVRSNTGREPRASGKGQNPYTMYQVAAERGGTTPFNLLPIPGGGPRNPNEHGHGAATPLDLCSWWVRYICPPGGVVLDPFVGSGTVGLASKGGRSFIGIEKHEKHYATARRRLTHAAGKSKDQLFGVLE